MSLSDRILGAHYRHPDFYVVEREKTREYANAVKNTDPEFFSDESAAELGYGGLAAPLTFISVFGYVAQVASFTHHGIKLADHQIVHVDQVLKFLKPVAAGDTLYAESTVLEKRESRSRPTEGIVTVATRGWKQDGTTVMTFNRSVLVPKRP